MCGRDAVTALKSITRRGSCLLICCVCNALNDNLRFMNSKSTTFSTFNRQKTPGHI